MQKTMRMRHRDGLILVAATMCVWVACKAAHAGSAFDSATQLLAPETALARNTPPMKQSLTARQAAAISAQPLRALAVGLPRQSIIGREPSPQVAPTAHEGRATFPIQWQQSSPIARAARNYKHDGVPIVHLWGSGTSLLAIGVSPRGIPGIYFTHEVKE
jgi:hypothetical protein